MIRFLIFREFKFDMILQMKRKERPDFSGQFLHAPIGHQKFKTSASPFKTIPVIAEDFSDSLHHWPNLIRLDKHRQRLRQMRSRRKTAAQLNSVTDFSHPMLNPLDPKEPHTIDVGLRTMNAASRNRDFKFSR